MKCPYVFPLRSRASMIEYLGEHESYWPMNAWNRGFVISWNVKVYDADFTGKSGGESVNRLYDDRWREYADRNDNRLFWQACMEAARYLREGDYTTYPGSDQGAYAFAFNGKLGGHMWLSRCDIVRQPCAWAMAPFIFHDRDHWRDYLSELSFPDLRKLYKAIACMDQDFTHEKVTAEVSYRLNYYRYAWEQEQEEAQTEAARNLEASRPDMYGGMEGREGILIAATHPSRLSNNLFMRKTMMNTLFEIPLGDEQENTDATEAPDLLAFITLIARMKQDGEDGFVMENDDAVITLNELIDCARTLCLGAEGK